jgi:multidrug resistance efflux pump
MKIRFRSPKQLAPDREQGVRVPYAPAKRSAVRWRWYLILLLVSLPLLYLVGQILYSWLVVKAPGYVSLAPIQINSSAAGQLAALPVKIGARVTSGQLLARVSSAALDRREALITAELNALASQATMADPAGSLAPLLIRRLELAAGIVNHYRKNCDDVRFLFDHGAATRAEVNLAQSQLHQAELSLQGLRADLASSRLEFARRKAPDPGRKTRMEVLRAEIQAIDAERAQHTITSPSNGRILDVLAAQGQALATGTPLLLLGNLENVLIYAYLNPRHARYALENKPVTIIMGDGRRLGGRINRTPELTQRLPAAMSSPLGSRDLMLLVPVVPDQPLEDADLVEGLPVTVRFPFRLGFPF